MPELTACRLLSHHVAAPYFLKRLSVAVSSPYSVRLHYLITFMKSNIAMINRDIAETARHWYKALACFTCFSLCAWRVRVRVLDGFLTCCLRRARLG